MEKQEFHVKISLNKYKKQIVQNLKIDETVKRALSQDLDTLYSTRIEVMTKDWEATTMQLLQSAKIEEGSTRILQNLMMKKMNLHHTFLLV